MGTKPLVIKKCICNRPKRDISDLAVVKEQFRKSPTGGPSTYSLVVCLRKGCGGSYRSADVYVEGLPRIWYRDYKKMLDSNP
jgi:hypothetical protein